MTDEEIERTTEAVARDAADGDEAVYEQMKPLVKARLETDRRMLRRVEWVEKWLIPLWVAALAAVGLLLLWNKM